MSFHKKKVKHKGTYVSFKQETAEKPARRENPHKYLLYKPTFSQLYTFLAASFKVCGERGCASLQQKNLLIQNLPELSCATVTPHSQSVSNACYCVSALMTLLFVWGAI